MIEFWRADLRDCPPTVVLCRVVYRLTVREYKVNPLLFGNPSAALVVLADRLHAQGLYGLAASACQASEYIARRKRKLSLWRFDVCRVAGKAILRSRDRRMSASEKVYPRITNRGVDGHQSWLEDLPEGLPDVRTPAGRVRL